MFKKRFGVTDIVVGESGDIYFVEDAEQDDELERIREEQRLKEEERKNKIEAERLAEERRLKKLEVKRNEGSSSKNLNLLANVKEEFDSTSFGNKSLQNKSSEIILPTSVVFVDQNTIYKRPSTSTRKRRFSSDSTAHEVFISPNIKVEKDIEAENSFNYTFDDSYVNYSSDEDRKSPIIKIEPLFEVKNESKRQKRSSPAVKKQLVKKSAPRPMKKHQKSDYFRRSNLICDFCGETLHGKLSLVRHLHTHLPPGAFTCNDCGEDCKTRKNLVIHRNWKHRRVVRLKDHFCTFCGKHFFRRNFKDHQRNIHGYGNCEICGHFTSTKEEFKAHLNTHENFPCSLCTKAFALPSALKRHEDITHTGKYKEYIENYRKNYNKGSDIIFRCEFCVKTFDQKNNFYRHQRYTHGRGKCEVCDFFFESKDEMFTHMQTHGPFKCVKCQKTYLHPSSLKSHMSRHLMLEAEARESEGIKKEKRVVSSKINRYACTECDDKFADKNSLEYHMRYHGIITQYPCEVCGKVFPTPINLRVHQKNIHEIGIKCGFCKIEIGSKAELKEHMKIHGNFDCQICSKSFIGPSELKQHMKLKHESKDEEEERVDCSFCGKSLNERRLRAHVFRFHKDGFEAWQKGEAEKAYTGPSKQEFSKVMKQIDGLGKKIDCDFCPKQIKPKLLRAHVKKFHAEHLDRWCKEFFGTS